MGLLNSALHIGRNAILGYQGALQTIGNNISSVGSPDYTRLTPDLTALQGSKFGVGLQPGAGVSLSEIQRNVDEALEDRLRLAIGNDEAMMQQEQVMNRMEALFDDINGTGLASQFSTFFNTFDDLQNTPEDVALRDLALGQATQLASTIQSLTGQINGIRQDADAQIADLVDKADAIGQQIADLNRRIAISEAGAAGQATGLRDQRDALLRDLSSLFDVSVRSQSDGTINVYIGSETLVQGNTYRGLTTVEELDGEQSWTTIRFADTGAEVAINGGKLGGIITARDEFGTAQLENLDQLAASLIYEVNKLHSHGQGLEGFKEVVGAYDLIESDVALNDSGAGLSNTPQSGSFFITVADDTTNTPVAYRIDVKLEGEEDDTTLDSLVAQINSTVTGVTAEVTNDKRLKISADTGFSFTFGHDGNTSREDTSNVLAALGVNTLFTGNSAATIAVNEDLIANPALLSASSVFMSGDGSIARQIASLSAETVSSLSGTSITNFYNMIAGSVAVEAAGANERAEAANSVLLSLQAQREGVSGVSLDEEAIELLKYERSFQGASRYVNVVNDMLSELIALIR